MNNSQQMILFADQYLSPYKVKSKQDGGEEIIPELCPFCHGGDNGDKETFALSVDKEVYVCKRGTCGKRGHFRDLAEFFGDHRFAGSIGTAGFAKQKPKAWKLPDTLLSPPTETIYQYFEKRCISRETVDAFKLQSDDHGMIVFPFFENGVNVFEKFRRPWKPKPDEKKKEWRAPGTKPVLFGMDLCSFAQPLVITEGEIDAMSLYEAGVANVVSVPSGCEDLSWIENCWDWLEKFRRIILFGDNDEPGRRMVQQVAKRLDESRCAIVEDYPVWEARGRECKDANEILFALGPFALIEAVESARQVPIKGLIDLGTVTPYDPTTVPRIKTMIPALDATIGGLAEGSITIFTGGSGEGKSTISGLLLLNAIEQGHNVCAYSGELPKEQFQEWINLQCAGSEYIGLKYDAVSGRSVPYLSWQVQQRLSEYYGGKFFLFDNNEIFEHNQAESILEVFTMAVRRYGCKLFLVDNLMTSLSDVEEETRAQGKFIGAIKKFATRFSVHVLVVAHPRKRKPGEAFGKSDVSGNSSIVNLADSAIVVEKPNLRIIKNRRGGIEKLIECCYCGDSRRIYQADAGDLNKFSWNKEGVQKPDPRADSLPEYGVTLAQTLPF